LQISKRQKLFCRKKLSLFGNHIAGNLPKENAMQILKVTPQLYPEDPARFFNFERFEDKTSNIYFFWGASNFDEFNFHIKKRIAYLELEEPNRFWGPPLFSPHQRFLACESLLYKVFTICPYTADWMNAMQGNKKRTSCFFPFNENYIPEPCEKKYDVIYGGHIVANSIKDIVSDISHFNYRFVSQSSDPRVTDKNASYKEKLRLVAESKISIVANVLYPTKGQVVRIWSLKNYRQNEAFRLIPRTHQFWKLLGNTERFVVPQIKARVFEAAFARTLILCRRDPFNVIERFFEPDKEFAYYEEGHLQEKIREVLDHYDHFKIMAENAFQRASHEYTTECFFEKYLKDLA
jgi:hypothetical protein